jgi:hypothetical protein
VFKDELYSMLKAIGIMFLGLCLVVFICVVNNIEGDVEAAPDETMVTTAATEETAEETTAPTEETVFVTEPSTEPTIEKPKETEPTDIPELPSEPPSKPVSEEKKENVGMTELEMLACVIYQEAGGNGSCDDCRRYVADIVLNRVNDSRFPDSIYKVLTAKNQYGKFYKTGIRWPSRAKKAVEQDAVARAYRIAEEVLNGQHSKLYGEGYVWQAGFEQGDDGFWCCGHYYGRS